MSSQSYLEKLLNGAEVAWLPLGDVLPMRAGQHIPAKDIILDASEAHPYPCFGGNGIRGYVKERSHDGEHLLIGRQGALCGNVKRMKGKFYATEHAVVVTATDSVNIDYAFHLLTMMNLNQYASQSAQPGLAVGKLQSLQIPIPCPDDPKKSLEIQAETVRILDTFTSLTAELTAELTARKKQYNYFRNQLLTFDEDEVEWKPLERIAQYSKTRISHDQLDKMNYVGVDNLLQNRAGKGESSHVPVSGNLTEYHKGDILIGNIRPYLKKIWHADCIGGTNGDVLVIHITDKSVNSRYLYQVLADDKFFEYNMQHAKGAKMPRGNKRKIMEYSIPIPKNEAEQARIVSILDKFNALTHSISEGLPREIELRQKQYAYYRDLLLNFPKPQDANNP